MKRVSMLTGLWLLCAWGFGGGDDRCAWEQWGQSSSHEGSVCVAAQPANRTLAQVTWCINAPAVDSEGNVYVTSEDGFFYGIAQGGIVKDQVFLDLNDGAAYTPLSIDRRGRIYTLNTGVLTVLGR